MTPSGRYLGPRATCGRLLAVTVSRLTYRRAARAAMDGRGPTTSGKNLS